MLWVGVVLATTQRRSPFNIFWIFLFLLIVLVRVCFGLAWFWLPSNIEVHLNIVFFFVVACVGVWFVLAWLWKPDISLGQKKLDTAATSFYLELFVRVLLSVDDDPCFISLFL